ncbi:pre-mRNA-splicing factor prp46 [Tilletia horrida]|uniref:Pre-mRNA-splicing factor PRP46 n=1 Tax=Tilletia horrida TaxID=155126 RepID=A0AAN6GE30_9BASI|nr:pre-mRNA-splicing factor prp46 [Tilletia horrida]
MADTATAPAASTSSNGGGGAQPAPDLADLIARSAKRTRYLFSASDMDALPSLRGDTASEQAKGARIAAKIHAEYADVQVLPPALLAQQAGAGAGGGAVGPVRAGTKRKEGPSMPVSGASSAGPGAESGALILAGPSRPGYGGGGGGASAPGGPGPSLALVALRREEGFASAHGGGSLLSTALIRKKEAADRQAKPAYHAQWKLKRVISGHLGWVRAIAVEPGNKWFVTGAGDRMIKIWDLASGELKLSLTGHISTVRGLAVSPRHPYLFSCGEDKMVKCWDLETNKVIRSYHGHLSGIYSLALHPTLDVLVTAGRDASARVWDMRTKAQVHVLSGHRGTIASVVCQEADPQVITGSMDATVRLWDLAAGRSMTTLTHHKKSVRALAVHPAEFTFASGSAGGRNIKTWKCPEGSLVNNMTHETIVNSLSVNADGVLFSGGDNGSLRFFDYATGVPFQSAEDIPQPGSLDAEAGIFCSTFDQAGIRLLTGGADKTIKVWAEAK